ncbi:ParB-like nuclease domain protein [Arthrobacter phage Abba]|uniref:ParB-like nuclease domain protein n=1 Tax=Arthrobacter phage Abba TaxID=2713256 RepID=A0A6G8R2F4_9CAUD|nr:ParB-like partition protein [Arthrobacter phage Abba]QIN94395.1 ParB-like nuclease domain protein [Arthrobacter phage Abba]
MSKPIVIEAGDLPKLAAALKKKPRVEHDLTIQYLPEAELAFYPGNSRKGDEDAIDESIGENGFFAPLTVQKSTGYILIGNHRFKVGKERYGLTRFPCVVVDVDDRAALKINLADNKTSDGSTYDNEKLIELLNELDDDFEGTAWTADELADLEDALNGGGIEDEGPADLKPASVVICPNCAHEFDPNLNKLD